MRSHFAGCDWPRLIFRLALSYNSLRDGCIDDSFSHLARLRYLNLKGNNFTHFPQAVSPVSHYIAVESKLNRDAADRNAFAGDPGLVQEQAVRVPAGAW